MSQQSAQDTLESLGGPKLSKEDFDRLYKGKLAEILHVVARHVVGRDKAANARGCIQQTRQSGSSGRQARPDEDADPLYAAVRRAESRLKNARIALENTQKIVDNQKGAIRESEHEKSQLQATLEDKRVTSLLLSILERKARIRNERVKEIVRLIDELRAKTSAHDKVAIKNELKDLTVSSKRLRADHTQDTLTALQAHALQLSRLSSAKDLDARAQEAEQRLTRAVAHSFSLSPTDEEVNSRCQELRALCQYEASQRVRYRSPLPTDTQKEGYLRDLTVRVNKQEQELQQLADLSSALILASAQSLQTITHFVKDTSPALQRSLQEESATATGYLDVLRLSISKRPVPATDSVRSEGLSRGQSFTETLDNVRHVLSSGNLTLCFPEIMSYSDMPYQAQDTEDFLQHANSLISPDPTTMEEHDTLIDTYMREEAQNEQRIKKLLERKGAKTEAGLDLVEKVEQLIAEVGIISGAHL